MTEKLIGQARPTNTTATSLYTVATDITVIVKTIVIANTSGSTAKYRLFHDESGTTYNETTALSWDVEVASGEKEVVNLFVCSNSASATFGVRTNTASALTFTMYGAEFGGVTTPSTVTALNSFFLTDGTTTDEVKDQETVKLDGTQGVKQTRVGDNNIQASLDVNTLTEDASPDLSADFVATYDVDAGTHKKVKLDEIGGGSSIYSANGTIASARTVNMDSKALGFTNASAGVGIGTATANASSILDLTSTTEGFLKPRMTGAQVEAISSPATGLEVYATSAGSGDVTIEGWWVYNGSNWIPSGAGLTQFHSSQILRYTESGGGSVEFDNFDAGSYNVLFLDPSGHDRDFTGIVAPPTGVNRVIIIINSGTNKKLKFKDNDTSDSTAANCFYLPERANFDLTKGSSFQVIYDHNVSRWASLSYY